MNSQRYESARAAYEINDLEGSKQAHLLPIHPTEDHSQLGQYLKSFIYGGSDGIITIFSIITACMGSNLDTGVILILGISNLIGNALSMSLGDYLSSKSEEEFKLSERKREEREIDEDPIREMIEMEEIYVNKGIDVANAKLMVLALSRCKQVWIDVMMSDELGILEEDVEPHKGALVTFFSFIGLGLVPLLPFIIGCFYEIEREKLFQISTGILMITLFSLGAAKTKIVRGNFVIHGMEVLIVGGFAACVAFLIGFLLEPLAN